jgi:hypothetical protein
LGDLLEEPYRIDHSNAELCRQARRELQKGKVDRKQHIGTEQLGGCKVKGIEALESHRKKVADTRRQNVVGEWRSRHLGQPEIDSVPPRLYGVEAILKGLRGCANQLGSLPRKSEHTHHSLCLKADQRLILSVKWPLQAAEIEVDAHDRSLPEFYWHFLLRGPPLRPFEGAYAGLGFRF